MRSGVLTTVNFAFKGIGFESLLKSLFDYIIIYNFSEILELDSRSNLFCISKDHLNTELTVIYVSSPLFEMNAFFTCLNAIFTEFCLEGQTNLRIKSFKVALNEAKMTQE